MAYSNWGAKVFRNGVRMKNREDVGVYDEDEAKFPSGLRIWMNLLKLKEKGEENKQWKHCYHAVLGDNEVRLCAYKNSPILWIWRKNKPEPERVELATDKEWEKYWENYSLEKEGEIEVNGKKWKWYFHVYENMLDLSLIEPDGTVWTATAGYKYGAGFE